ncbi:uncharacterized protein [Nothobranchius furzeri]|uniref:uncharacterized protein n=1 Tax=Nothobranchius furzeri TaxID=105023 RepID=UPI00390465B8
MEAADPGALKELHPLRTPSFSGVVGLVSPLFSCFPAPKPLPETQRIMLCTCSDRLSSTCRRAGFPRVAPAVRPLPGPRCGAYACRSRAAAASAGSRACSCGSLPGSHAYCCSPCWVPRLLLQFSAWVPRLLLQFSAWVPRLLLQFSAWVSRSSQVFTFQSSQVPFQSSQVPFQSSQVPFQSSQVLFQSSPVPVKSILVPVKFRSSRVKSSSPRLLCCVALWASGIRP